jgi:hypothetical protein
MPDAGGPIRARDRRRSGHSEHNSVGDIQDRAMGNRIPMTLADLDTAVRTATPLPAGAPPLVRALWHDATGDWDQAHNLAQDVDTAEGAWVHAYLHRKEGDPGNAGYWYRRAGQPPASGPLDAEWRAIATVLLR